ncbi:hypothetical protein ZIOFF_024582 [Zingiber officinale]|uniref:Piwi domain-containing protein n=1 Tax=Zingiber officinale TaxID=94328 RepID=A0A8J5HCN8_ZINOF|nr:hypothetical protein ZIOFF_024582 [Zingiber officinale]
MGLGVRSRCYALLAEDGVVKVLNLEDGGLASSVEYIPNARVPLLKYISKQHNISFDVSVNNHLGVMKSNVLKWLSKIDDRFRDTILVLKEWAKAQDINDPKSRSLSSYALCLLVIFHFQTYKPPIFPLLRAIINEERILIEIVDDLSTLQIEDPFERMENAARTVRWVELPKISNAFQNAHNKLSSDQWKGEYVEGGSIFLVLLCVLRLDSLIGGRDTVLVDALSRRIPLVSDQPTIIFGADITHPHPGEDSSPSVAVVVAS